MRTIRFTYIHNAVELVQALTRATIIIYGVLKMEVLLNSSGAYLRKKCLRIFSTTLMTLTRTM